MTGQVSCLGGLVVDVEKRYDVRVVRGREEIRGFRYRYTARLPGLGNLLRYDNLHEDVGEFHRHEYDPVTWQESRRTVLTREELPVMTEVIDEAVSLARAAGIL